MGGEALHRRERRLAELLARQHGVLARRQLLGLGFGRRAIDNRLRKHQLRVVHGGVYALGALPLLPRGRWLAAVLACGEGALLSHWSAASLWGLLRERPGLPHVTAPRNRHSRRGLVIHRVFSMPAGDCAQRDQIPVTSLARTLLDIASIDRGQAVARALEEADRLRLLEVGEIERLLERRRGQPGTRRLRAALDAHRVPLATRSELERLFVEAVGVAGLPLPSVNVMVEGHEVDALWRQAGLVVELDGWKHHGGRAAFERDRARDLRLGVAGYRVIRLTYRQLRDTPAEAIAAVRTLLFSAMARSTTS